MARLQRSEASSWMDPHRLPSPLACSHHQVAMIGFLLLVLAAQDTAAIMIPGNVQMERGPVLGKCWDSPGFFICYFTLGTQLPDLNSCQTCLILRDRVKIPGTFLECDLLVHSASSPLRMIALACLEEAAEKLRLDEEEVKTRTILECSFLMMCGFSQGSRLRSAKALNIEALLVSKVNIQARLSSRRRQLMGGRSTPEQTTVWTTRLTDLLAHPSRSPLMVNIQMLAWLRYQDLQFALCALEEAQIPSYLTGQERIQQQASPGGMGLGSLRDEAVRGTGLAFMIHVRVKEMEARLLFFWPHATVQQNPSLKLYSNAVCQLGNSRLTFDSTPGRAYQETVVPQRRLAKIHTPQTVRRAYHLCFHPPGLRKAVKKHRSVARIQAAHSPGVANTQQTYGPLLSPLNRCSVNFTLPSNTNSVPVPPPRSFLLQQRPFQYPLDPKGSLGQVRKLCLFCGQKPRVKQLFCGISKSEKDSVRSEVPGDYDSHGLLSNLLGLLYAIFLFYLVIIFEWMLEQWLVISDNWNELLPLAHQGLREFRLRGEAVIRHLCCNILRTY